MHIDCPHPEKSRIHLPVNVVDGICDIVDLCKFNKTCCYYDDTVEGTKRFHRALRHYHTLAGMIETKINPRVQLERRPPEIYDSSLAPQSNLVCLAHWQASQ